MKRFTYLLMACFLLSSLSVLNAQQHVALSFSGEMDAEDVATWWTSNPDAAQWALVECEEVEGSFYGLFTWDASVAPTEAWDWATDLKCGENALEDALPGKVDEVKHDLHINFWVNVFDGVNAGDSLYHTFETSADVGGGGWPNYEWLPEPGVWQWVSIDLSGMEFSENLPENMENVTEIKFAVRPAKEYTEGVFKVGIQDVTISAGPATPTAEPCYVEEEVTTSAAVISQAGKAETLTIYPNPAVNQQEVRLASIESGVVIDLTGSQVASFQNSNRVNIENLSQGVYLVRTNSHKVGKLIVR